MDARALLQRVADTYTKLESFEVEILSTTESGDEDSSHRNSHRTRAYYVAPDKVRIDQCGRNGTILVTDGVDTHCYFRGPNRYSSGPVPGAHPPMGSFYPGSPVGGAAIFVFHHIAENVASTEILEDGAETVLSVDYDPAGRADFIVAASPITFWIDPRTHLVSRMECEVTRVHPDGEPRASKHAYSYAHALVNQEIPRQTFEFTPPPDAIDNSGRRRSGCGNSRSGPNAYETWHNANWEDSTFVDHFDLKIRALDLVFERRLTFEGNDLQISEKIIGPKGPAEHRFSIKVSE